MVNQLNKAFTEALVNIISSLYNTVGHLYNFMLEMLQKTLPNFDVVADFTSGIYVLVGVFMLFRVTITAINYLINPDQVDDKSAGAGKVVTRIVISLILLLTLNSFIFPMLNELQTILINPDENDLGLIWKLFPAQNNNSEAYNTTNEINNTNVLSQFDGVINDLGVFDNVLEVQAADDTSTPFLTCYYLIGKASNTANPNESNLGKNSLVKLVYSRDSNGKLIAESVVENSITTDGRTFNFIKLNIDNTKSFPSEISWLNGCGSPVYNTTNGQNGNIYTTISKNILSFTTPSSSFRFPGGLIRGNSSVDAVIQEYLKLVNEEGRTEDIVPVTPVGGNYLHTPGRVEGNGLNFARNVAKGFQYCNTEKATLEQCETIQENMFQSVTADNNLVDAVKKGEITIDLLISILVAIGLVVYILLLIVDIIVRNLKLMVLQMIAPIAIVSYIDPKDKIFDNWLKGYASAYLDLFLKLAAISIVIKLLNSYSDMMSGMSTWAYLAFIFAVFTFAKTLPNYLSKLLGIDNFGGTFKETFGALKTAGGMAAGAVIGGAVGGGFAAIQGGDYASIAGGMLGGAGKGLKAGASGKGFGDAMKKQMSANRNSIAGRANGATFGQTLLSKAQQALGVSDKYERLKSGVEAQETFKKKFDNMKDVAKGEVAKDWSSVATVSANGGRYRGNVNNIRQQLADHKDSIEIEEQVQHINGDTEWITRSFSATEAASMVGLMEKQAVNDMIDGKSNDKVEILHNDLVDFATHDVSGTLSGYGISSTTSADTLGTHADDANSKAIHTTANELRVAKANYDAANGTSQKS